MIFEIACGYELTEIAPSEAQYREMKEEKIREILQFIFQTDREGAFSSSIDQVRVQRSKFQDPKCPLSYCAT